MTRQEEITLARMVEMRKKIDKFEDSVLIDLEKTYKNAAESLLNQVKAAKGKSARLWTNTRLIAMLEETQLMHQTIVQQLSTKSAGYIADAGVFSYKEMNNIVSWDGRVQGFNNVSLSKTQMQQLVTNQKLGGKTLNEWMGSVLEPDIDTIKANISTGLIAGEGYSKVVSRLQNALSLPKGSKEARDMESVVKTYMHSVNVKAQQDVYEANSSVVKQVEWSAILESGYTKSGRGTCPRCIALDGQRWATTNYNRPPCPLHVRCRCILVPITKTWRELGIDVDEMEDVYQPYVLRDKKGNALFYGNTDKTYGEWWKTQSKQFQDNSIGPRRAELVRSGLIDIPDLVDNVGNLILLEDLPKTTTFTDEANLLNILPKSPVFDPIRKQVEYAAKSKKSKSSKAASMSASALRAFSKSSTKAKTVDVSTAILQVKTKVPEKIVSGMPTVDKLKAAISPQVSDAISKEMDALLVRQAELKGVLKLVDSGTRSVIAKEIEANISAIRKLEKTSMVDGMTTIGKLIKPAKSKLLEFNTTGTSDMYMQRPEVRAYVKDAISYFSDTVLDKLPKYNLVFKAKERSGHYALTSTIQLGRFDTKLLIHELSHAIEFNYPEASAAALSFLKKRAGKETLSRISNFTGEYGWKDKFFDHYVGKYYDTGSTEIFSMGMERMFTDPHVFLTEDPEHFELVLKFMWGAL